MRRLWAGIGTKQVISSFRDPQSSDESSLLMHSPDTTQITPPFRVPEFSDAAYQAFRTVLDYESVARAVFGEHRP